MQTTMNQAMQQLFLGNTEGLDQFQLQELTRRRQEALRKIENMGGEPLFFTPHYDHANGTYVGETFYYEVEGSLCTVSTTTHIQSFGALGGPTDEVALRQLREFLDARRQAKLMPATT